MNIFDNSTEYLNEIISKLQITNPNVKRGKSLAAVFFTKICKAGCPFCFFKSSDEKIQDIVEKQEFTDEGYKNFIDFINSSNIELLLISGGGEPFEKYEYILKTLAEAKVDKIYIITSGYWAGNYENAQIILQEIESTIKNRNDKLDVVLRVSVDKSHVSRIGDDKIKNIIRIFEKNFIHNENFKLQIHTMQNDSTVDKIALDLNANKSSYQFGEEINKNNNRYLLTTQKGLKIQVESAKIFSSNLKVNLKLNSNQKIKDVFFDDLKNSQQGSFSCYIDRNNIEGLDYLINYNGNVSTWGNYQRYNAPNLYIHSPKQIHELLYRDVISYSFLNKTYMDINSAIREVNPNAATRSILINIRDFSGSYLLEEDHTALYYAIVTAQEYLKSGIIDKEQLKTLSPELQCVLLMTKGAIIKKYKESSFDIFQQLKQSPFIKDKWNDIFELIKLGHYSVTPKNLLLAENYYLDMTKRENSQTLFKPLNNKQQTRLLEKLCPMNTLAEKSLKNRHKTKESKKHENSQEFNH